MKAQAQVQDQLTHILTEIFGDYNPPTFDITERTITFEFPNYLKIYMDRDSKAPNWFRTDTPVNEKGVRQAFQLLEKSGAILTTVNRAD